MRRRINHRGFLILIFVYMPLILLSSSIVLAGGVSFYDKEYIVIDSRISSSIDLLKVGVNPSTEYIIADLFFHPFVDDRLEILSMRTLPRSKTIDSRVRFTWLAPEEVSVDFSVNARLKSKTVYAQIPNKVVYPLSFVPPEAAVYLRETGAVDFSDLAVRSIAEDLAKDQDDLFLMVSAIAAWTRSAITYNLSSVNVKASKPASWVLRNRQGVCDEITNLFIAILRSKGIPAKFISGLSYTNSDSVEQPWGAHGWAEVFFPGYGWVPFDPTYGQFGWIDPSHIKLKEGLDATEPSTTYEWRARDVKLGIHPLRLESKVVEEGPKMKIPISLSVEPARRVVGIGSYNVILARLSNLENSYLDVDVTLGQTDGVVIVDPPRRDISFRPFETVQVSWIVKVDSALSGDFVYTFPMNVFTQRNASAVGVFNSSDKEPLLSMEDAQAIVSGSSAEGLGLSPPDCVSSDSRPRQDEVFTISCDFSLPKDIASERVVLCAGGLCNLVSPSDQGVYNLSVSKGSPGHQEILVTLNVANRSSYSAVKVTVLDSPRLVLFNASAPEMVGFDDRFNVSVVVRRVSLASPRIATLAVRLPGLSASWPVQEVQENDFSIAVSGSDIAGAGGIDVILRYEDDSGRMVEEVRRVEISMKSLDAWQSVRMLFSRIGFWIHDNIPQNL